MGSTCGQKSAQPFTEETSIHAGEAKARNDQIEKELREEVEKQETLIKILLLGGSESGKTTVFKQMRILHMNGFTRSDLINYRFVIHTNAVHALFQLIEACTKFRMVHEYDMQIDEFVEFKNTDFEYELDPKIVHQMATIWKSKNIQNVYERRFEFDLLDSAKYFLDQLPNLGDDSYLPTQEDILHCRYRTTGISEISFEFKELIYRMVDVGGQRTERRKWLHCFDQTNLILFVLSAADYDSMEPEEQNVNRLLFNIGIYKSIIGNKYFSNSSVVAFINKKDIFTQKLSKNPVSVCFADYAGVPTSEEGLAFIKSKLEIATPAEKQFFAFYTTATDTQNIELVFKSTVAIVKEKNMKTTGLHL